MIEADDHAAPDVDAVLLDAMHALEQRAGVRPHILVLLGLAQRILIRRLDADEDALEIGETHQFHQLLVLGEIERSLGEESERISALLLPLNDVAQHRFDRLFVADQIVVDDEDDLQPGLSGRLELGQDLLARLEARPAAEGHDDVAELASERAAAGDLQASEHIPIGLQQIDARQRQPGHVGLLGLLIAALGGSPAPSPARIAAKSRPLRRRR